MKYTVVKNEKGYFRIIDKKESKILVINCLSKSLPKWINEEDFYPSVEVEESEFLNQIGKKIPTEQKLSPIQLQIMYQRYGTISLILPVVGNEYQRRETIKICAERFNVSPKTIRYRLCDYLIFGTIYVLAPYISMSKKELSQDEKNFRWAINKYYYNPVKMSLKEAYRRMLSDKYCEENGKLKMSFPTYRQFSYYYYKNVDEERKIIAREGKGKFMRDYRALLGNSVRDFCNSIGYGMFDSTICDIFLINDQGELLGRPILTACVDAYSHLCLGYSLGFKGGLYSLRRLIENMLQNKVNYCNKFGIKIESDEWPCIGLPHKFITDKGKEYVSETFSQLAELGIEIINLQPYRPELKSCIEKFFDLIQKSYKIQLASKGVIFNDYQERGGCDYRKKACLTIDEFEKIIIHCIVNYNSKTLVDLPLNLSNLVEPFSNKIWNYLIKNYPNNMILSDELKVKLTLLPRTKGFFKRKGLYVNKLRYRNYSFMERYLSNTECLVAFDPDNVGKVWLFENGQYYEFEIIDGFLENKTLIECEELIRNKRDKKRDQNTEIIQGKIDLHREIDSISKSKNNTKVDIKNVREHRNKEIKRS